MHKIEQSGRFLGRLLGPLLKTGLSLMKNVLKVSVKSVLISLGLTAAAAATDAVVHKKIFGFDATTLMSFKPFTHVIHVLCLSRKII